MPQGSLAPSLILIAAALVAILGLAVMARRLGLGADVRLRDADTAGELARAADCRFTPTVVALDRAGLGALLADQAGQVVLLRRHGARFVAHRLTSHAGVRLERQFLCFALPEPGFVPITLDLGPEAQHWAASLRRLGPADARP
ncbi:hypothetical protein ACFOON_14830 [Novosphingobium piscinae]|uniref:Uncharacterized protein n=1 Tax=Novosphingobium piscinae TaxID=1507448 RepID=A0A7X1G2M0_9SPHN|nr:hypothetical protein [Novosphingobium piscinae]MBC2670847.1 hypothetical protein [Novosphingobium piscinae]